MASINYSEPAAKVMIAAWQVRVNLDPAWERETFTRIYNAVKQNGLEDFTNTPPIGDPNAFIPLTHEESQHITASICAHATCEHFTKSHPFLSKIVWSDAGAPTAQISSSITQWFQVNRIYPGSKAVDIASDEIGNQLSLQAHRLSFVLHILFVVLFLLAQAVPFSLIGWAAYRDIRPRM